MSIYNLNGDQLQAAYNINNSPINMAYDIHGNAVWSGEGPLPVPSGDLYASSRIELPDIYDPGKGFTCTGLAYDSENECFLVGDIGALLPGENISSKIIKLSPDFSSVVGAINVASLYSNMRDIQGITIDTTDQSIWFCSPSENKIHHIDSNNNILSDISIQSPTGIAYDSRSDTLWVLNYDNKIIHITKSGSVIETFNFAYSDTLDQCFLDVSRGYLYITAGANYSSRNDIYLFDTSTHAQSITCIVDSYSLEGIWIGENRMVIVNDGYYHSAYIAKNEADIYDLSA